MPGDFLTINPQAAGALARRGSAEIVRLVTLRTAARAAALAPGHMGHTVRPILKGTKSSPLGIVMVDHPAASYVLNGTKPHPIYPRNKKALRFTTGGRVVFARMVNHPGTKPNNFLMKAMLESRVR